MVKNVLNYGNVLKAFKGFVLRDSEDGRVTVFDGDKFGASCVDVVWSDIVFAMYDLRENFNDVRDEAEAKRLLNEAKASLSVRHDTI